MNSWIGKLVASIAVFGLSGASGWAENDEAYPLMPRAEEIALARSAGLAPWNEEASVYVLEEEGYKKAVEGSNGFTCVVGRDYPGTRWPICFDAVGTETLLPRVLREGEMRRQGATKDEVHRDTSERFLSGEYRAPSRTGIAYMLSPQAITSNGKTLLSTPPHLMIYAPNIDPQSLGAVARHPHSPIVLYPGDPHAYIVVFVRDELPAIEPLGEVPPSPTVK